MSVSTPEIKLTQYSHGAGCGCKIAPKVLDSILKQHSEKSIYPRLIVGNEERDDAAVLDLGDGTGIISTTDFFMPIVDNPTDFGRIAAVNAISDVYAMGGTPILAVAILGWPVSMIPPAIANDVLAGARSVCAEAGIPLAGGHSIDSMEPIFGLAVTGRVRLNHLKKNGGATPGCRLFLTKPLGVGILSTALKNGRLQPGHLDLALRSMCTLNRIGEQFGQLDYVHAMTDVTGFGLLGHLAEMCQASGLSAQIAFDEVPTLGRELLEHYIYHLCVPAGTNRNFDAYRDEISPLSENQKAILFDPQTSGGLLVAVEEGHSAMFQNFCRREGLELSPFGKMVPPARYLIEVI
jgi:selenide,water dikinase